MYVNPNTLRLYAITDRQWLKNMSLSQAVEQAILGGATMVQLREKDTPYDTMLNIALSVKAVTDKYNIPLIINDNVMLAKEIDADGVHVGADDTSVLEARKILGDDKIIGGTARTLERAMLAYKQGADYLGIGAVFNTSTKSGTTHMTKELANSINKAVDIPTVAIGGININNISSLKNYGVSGVAVVSGIFNNDNITKSTQQLRKCVDEIFA